jgi:hypothetical protein
VQRWEAMLRYRHLSRAPAQQWNVYGSGIGLRQRRALLCRGALCAVLVSKLMRFQGRYGARNVLHHACCVISRRHFLVSKNAAETLFEKVQRLYWEQRYREAAESWEQAALLQHAPSHAFLSSLLIEGRAEVAKDEQRAFEFASGGAALGCAHSKGALGRCLAYGAGVAQDAGRGLALARESAASGSSFGQFVVGRCYDAGRGVAQDDAEAVRWYRLAAQQHRDIQALRSTWASCLRMVKVLRRTMWRLFDYTALQQHRDMQALSTTWATCLSTGKVLRRIQQRPFDYTALQQHRVNQTPQQR